MRPIHSTHLDKVRPVLILTREAVRPHLRRVTVARRGHPPLLDEPECVLAIDEFLFDLP